MKKILIVEDSRVVRSYIARALKEFGLDNEQADNSKQALEMATTSMPDGIILDWDARSQDGEAFLASIRALPNGKETAVIFCVTEGEFPKKIDYITKPLKTDKLKAKLKKLKVL